MWSKNITVTALISISLALAAEPKLINPAPGINTVKLGALPAGWKVDRGTWSIQIDETLPAEGSSAALKELVIDHDKSKKVTLPKVFFSGLKGGILSYKGKKFDDFTLIYQMKHATERDYWGNEMRFRVSDNGRDYYMAKRERYGKISLYRAGSRTPLQTSKGVLQATQEQWIWVKIAAEGNHIKIYAATDGVNYEKYIDYQDKSGKALKSGFLTMAGPRRFKFAFAPNPWNDDLKLKAAGAWVTRAETGTEIRQTAGSDTTTYTAKVEIFVDDLNKAPKIMIIDQDGEKSKIKLSHLRSQYNTLYLPVNISNNRKKASLKFTLGKQTSNLEIENSLITKGLDKPNLPSLKASDFSTEISQITYRKTLEDILNHYGYFGGRFPWDTRNACLYVLYKHTGDKKYLDGMMLWIRDDIKKRETGKAAYKNMGFADRPWFACCAGLALEKGELTEKEKETFKALISDTLANNNLEGGGVMNRALGYALMPEKLLKIIPDHPMREQLLRYPNAIRRDLLTTKEILENSSNYLPLSAFYILQFIEDSNLQNIYQTPEMKKFFEFLLDLVDPSGAIPQFGDYGGKRLYHPLLIAVYEKIAAIYKDGRFKWAAAQMMRGVLQNFDMKKINGHDALGFAFAMLWADDSIKATRPSGASVLHYRNIGILEKLMLRSSMKPEAFNVFVDFVNGGEHGDNMAFAVIGICNNGGQSLLDKAGREAANHSMPLIRDKRANFPYKQKYWNFNQWNNGSFDLRLFWSWGDFPGGASSKLPTVGLKQEGMFPNNFAYDPEREFAFIYQFSGSGKAYVYLDNIRLVKDGETPDKPAAVKMLDDFENDSYNWIGNYKQVPGGINGKRCGRFLIDFAGSQYIGKNFPIPFYVYDNEYDRIEFDFKIEPVTGTFDRWSVLHIGDNSGTTRNFPAMHLRNYKIKTEYFQENPRSTFAMFRLDDRGETGKVRTTRREFMFAKDKFLWVRDEFILPQDEEFAAGPVWQIGELTGAGGENWYDTKIDTNLLFFFPRKPYGKLELISNPSPTGFEDGLKKQYPALLTYCVDGKKPARRYIFDTILLPHDGKGDVRKLADSIKVLYDKDNITLIQVGEDLMLRNPEGKDFAFNDLKTTAKILYIEKQNNNVISKGEYK